MNININIWCTVIINYLFKFLHQQNVNGWMSIAHYTLDDGDSLMETCCILRK